MSKNVQTNVEQLKAIDKVLADVYTYLRSVADAQETLRSEVFKLHDSISELIVEAEDCTGCANG